MRKWRNEAVRIINADYNRSADTHLIKLEIPSLNGIHLYLKDESIHPTGSLKHRLARSLFLYGLCNGWIHENTTIIEASSGSTAVSEAYFARLLGLPFIAVIPATTSPKKIAQIEFYGGRCHLVENASSIYKEAYRIEQETAGHFMDQFTYAERATDWRGNNNIAESIFLQMSKEPFAIPTWIICGCGTGGTSATIGRYIGYLGVHTKLCVVDPENSVFYDYYHSHNRDLTLDQSSKIEGIGRPRVEPSFIPEVVDKMLKIPDNASLAAIHFLEEITGRKYGGSTGTNFYGACLTIAEMRKRNEQGAIVTLICDPGERYLRTYYNQEWLLDKGYNINTYLEKLRCFYETGELPEL